MAVVLEVVVEVEGVATVLTGAQSRAGVVL